MGVYEDYITALQPSPLAKPLFLAFVGAFGKELDTHRERLRQAAQVNVIGKAPADALDTLGEERLLLRYPSESDTVYRARLKQAFTIWSKSGTKNGILAALDGAFPLSGTSWSTLEYAEDAAHFFSTGFWAQFEVIGDVDPILLSWEFGSGEVFGDPELTYGSTATPDQIKLLIKTVLDNKPQYSFAVRISLLLAAGETAVIPIQGFQ